MKPIFSFLLLSILISCTTRKMNSQDFVISVKRIASDNFQLAEFYYNSNTGELRRNRPEKNFIKLNEKEKNDIYIFYKKLELESNKCWFDNKDYTDSNYTTKYNFQFKKGKLKNGKCDSLNREEEKKFGRLYIKIYEMLQTKDDYKKEFPDDFEE